MSIKRPANGVERRREIQQRWRDKHRDEINRKAREWTKANPKARQEQVKKWRVKFRNRVIDAYGGSCTCCGETERRFLTIDHVKEDGAEERKRLWGSQNGGGFNIYFRVRKLGYPPQYQLLCWNCNFAKHHGGCPHKRLV